MRQFQIRLIRHLLFQLKRYSNLYIKKPDDFILSDQALNSEYIKIIF